MVAAREPVRETAMSFARPDLLPLVFIIPLLLAGAIWLYARRRERSARAFSDPHLLARLGGAELLRFPLPRLILIATAGAAVALAAAGPRWGYSSAEGESLSLNVVVATDISKSMLVPDIEPNRLERARLFARRMLRELPGDRFGLVVFAGRAYILSPLTSDHSALELYLDALDPEMVSQGGSSLAAAIAQATDLVRGSETTGGERAVVLLSDGEALEEIGGVEAAADRAARAGVRFITIGIGTPAGDRIPDIDPASGQVVGFKRDEAGEIVISRLDENLLRTVAERTGGRYVRMDDAAALSRVVGELRGMQRERGESTQRVQARERFALFAGLALLLLAFDMLVYGSTRLRDRATPVVAPAGGEPRPARRRTAHAAVIALLFVATGFGIGDLEKGNRLYREGKYEEAIAAYQRVVESGKASPQVHYNLGTALLALGRYDDADVHFQTALQGVEPELRERTFYNLGNRFLEDARVRSDVRQQGELLDAAIEAYKRSLRIDPQDTDAKWNLELALRDREENEQRQQSMPQQSDQEQEQSDESEQDQQQQAGGGSGSSESQSPAGAGDDRGTAMEDQPMSQEQADRILSAIEQDERDLTREKLRRGQRRVPVLRDW
jgi:Ca-activated chloride channel homolog